MTTRNGRRCARAPMPMSDAPDISRPKIIGARVKRTEDPRLLTGRGSFVDDRKAPDALHVAFRRSEHAHARIIAIDCAAARAMPGVIAVLTAQDLDFVRPLVATSRMKGYYATPILPLAREKGALCRRAGRRRHRREPLSRRGCARTDRDRFRAAPTHRRSRTGRAGRRAAAARGSRHQRAGRARVQARRGRCGVRQGTGARRHSLSHAPQEPAGDRAARGALPNTRPAATR